MKLKIEEILEYLADEQSHFWENCKCPEEIQKDEDLCRCKCKENKNHIWITMEEVKGWLDSPCCPLVRREELNDGKISLEQESINRREWAERYEDEENN